VENVLQNLDFIEARCPWWIDSSIKFFRLVCVDRPVQYDGCTVLYSLRVCQQIWTAGPCVGVGFDPIGTSS